MSTGGIFTANEIVEMAIQTEQSGYAFYNAAAEATRSDEVKQLLQWLAEAEQEHERTFREMLDVAGREGLREENAGQRSAYIQALLDSRVLPDAQAAQAAVSAMASRVDSLVESGPGLAASALKIFLADGSFNVTKWALT